MTKSFLLPDLGEGLTEAELITWLVKVGDTVELNQVIAEVETAKASVELPSPFAGTVTALHAEEGSTVEVGKAIIDIDEPGAPEERTPVLVGYGVAGEGKSRRGGRRPAPPAEAGGKPLASPPVRFVARQEGIDLADVPATGGRGEVTRGDLDAFLQRPEPVAPQPEDETRTPIKGVRKHTAAAMVSSAFSAPHVTEFITVDVTQTVELIEKLRSNKHFRDVRLTPLALVAKALLVALRANPSLNSEWDEVNQEIVTKRYVNLGIAAATPRGLMVPNIKGAHALGLKDLALALNGLTATAKEGKTGQEDLADGTITITNVGVFGVDSGTPILNPGEAAILCFGAIRRQPWEFEGEIALRSVTTLSLSFDHRLVDGEQGSRFLADVASMLADPLNLVALG
ncbi:dihydrolipoamide acetyltransferase family protein [Rhodococcoides kyotonense]|uniref:Dihydrolipoamide acetyltransferase component of pyruvate dehydrogenase complex n=1 Tax=Rhodococcoides kyotonense TaxID=398843 RepID=A0A239FKK0_9NOCA|nr:dihydrolipoamide acetyltransferase family protein [Rhodococcus kyotonensis]SNS56584.1 pyruvate dehydrogenase E2 component (dihydrolipoamide acetyltransferase) [Rhodococcus kyotonensis]